jgi:alpha-tubulin suppressor-like RCC1 family protein
MPRSHWCSLVACWVVTACASKTIAVDVSGEDESGTTTDDEELEAPRLTRFSVGSRHACAIEDELARCWGGNNLGQLGDGSTEPRPLGVTPLGPERVIDISAGSFHTCAVDGDGAAWCWGDGINGVLGDGSGEDQPLPVELDGLPPLAAISTEFVHTCALTRAGEVWCWGENNQGQLGVGEITFASFTPVQVQDLDGVVEISVGERHSCARLDDRTLRCWGDNGYGELGDGTRDNRTLPIAVPSCPALAVDAGSFRTCALCEDRSVQCWGDNWGGHLIGGDEDFVVEPTTIAGLANIVALSTSWAHACAVDDGGRVWCWGRNASGELGDGALEPRVVPAQASGSLGATKVVTAGTATGAITCINDPVARLACAGDTSGGQLGSDPSTQALTFLAVGE